MDLLHVVPPLRLIASVLRDLVDARLAEIFEDDVTALDAVEIVLDMVGRAVRTMEEAFIRPEVVSAHRATPCHKPRRDVDISGKLVSIFIKLLDEVESKLVIRTVPELNIDRSAFLFDCKLGRECRALLLFGKLNETLTFAFADKHGGNSDSSAGSIVTHDNIGHILNLVIDDNEQAGTSALSISHLVYERTFATTRNHNLCREGLRFLFVNALLHGFEDTGVATAAHIFVVCVEVDRANLNDEMIGK